MINVKYLNDAIEELQEADLDSGGWSDMPGILTDTPDWLLDNLTDKGIIHIAKLVKKSQNDLNDERMPWQYIITNKMLGEENE